MIDYILFWLAKMVADVLIGIVVFIVLLAFYWYIDYKHRQK